jgi:predicted DNA-binding transcriptional regulator AlpA
MITEPEPLLLTQKQVCALLGVHRDTLWEWNRRGKGPSRIQVGGRFYYPRSMITSWIDARKSSVSDVPIQAVA